MDSPSPKPESKKKSQDSKFDWWWIIIIVFIILFFTVMTFFIVRNLTGGSTNTNAAIKNIRVNNSRVVAQ